MAETIVGSATVTVSADMKTFVAGVQKELPAAVAQAEKQAQVRVGGDTGNLTRAVQEAAAKASASNPTVRLQGNADNLKGAVDKFAASVKPVVVPVVSSGGGIGQLVSPNTAGQVSELARVVSGELGSALTSAAAATGPLGAGLTNVVKAAGQMSGMVQTFAGLTAGAAALGLVIAKSVGEFTNLAVTVGDFKDLTSATALDASRLVAVMDDVGISATAGATAFGQLAKNADSKAFAALGIEVAKTKSGVVDLTATFGNILTALEGVDDPLQRANILTASFGRGFETLLPLISKGADEYQRMIEGTDQSQLISEEDIQSAREFKLLLDDLSDSLKAFLLEAGKFALPGVKQLVVDLTVIAKGVQGGAQALSDFASQGDNANKKAGILGQTLKHIFPDTSLGANAAKSMRDVTIAVDGLVGGLGVFGKEAPKTVAAFASTTAAAANLKRETALLDFVLKPIKATFGETGTAAKLLQSGLDGAASTYKQVSTAARDMYEAQFTIVDAEHQAKDSMEALTTALTGGAAAEEQATAAKKGAAQAALEDARAKAEDLAITKQITDAKAAEAEVEVKLAEDIIAAQGKINAASREVESASRAYSQAKAAEATAAKDVETATAAEEVALERLNQVLGKTAPNVKELADAQRAAVSASRAVEDAAISEAAQQLALSAAKAKLAEDERTLGASREAAYQKAVGAQSAAAAEITSIENQIAQARAGGIVDTDALADAERNLISARANATAAAQNVVDAEAAVAAARGDVAANGADRVAQAERNLERARMAAASAAAQRDDNAANLASRIESKIEAARVGAANAARDVAKAEAAIVKGRESAAAANAKYIADQQYEAAAEAQKAAARGASAAAAAQVAAAEQALSEIKKAAAASQAAASDKVTAAENALAEAKDRVAAADRDESFRIQQLELLATATEKVAKAANTVAAAEKALNDQRAAAIAKGPKAVAKAERDLEAAQDAVIASALRAKEAQESLSDTRSAAAASATAAANDVVAASNAIVGAESKVTDAQNALVEAFGATFLTPIIPPKIPAPEVEKPKAAAKPVSQDDVTKAELALREARRANAAAVENVDDAEASLNEARLLALGQSPSITAAEAALTAARQAAIDVVAENSKAEEELLAKRNASLFVNPEIAAAEEALRTARDFAKSLVPDLSAAEAALDAARQNAAAVAQANAAAEDALRGSRAEAGPPVSDLSGLEEALATARDKAKTAAEGVAEAEKERSKIAPQLKVDALDAADAAARVKEAEDALAEARKFAAGQGPELKKATDDLAKANAALAIAQGKVAEAEAAVNTARLPQPVDLEKIAALEKELASARERMAAATDAVRSADVLRGKTEADLQAERTAIAAQELALRRLHEDMPGLLKAEQDAQALLIEIQKGAGPESERRIKAETDYRNAVADTAKANTDLVTAHQTSLDLLGKLVTADLELVELKRTAVPKAERAAELARKDAHDKYLAALDAQKMKELERAAAEEDAHEKIKPKKKEKVDLIQLAKKAVEDETAVIVQQSKLAGTYQKDDTEWEARKLALLQARALAEKNGSTALVTYLDAQIAKMTEVGKYSTVEAKFTANTSKLDTAITSSKKDMDALAGGKYEAALQASTAGVTTATNIATAAANAFMSGKYEAKLAADPRDATGSITNVIDFVNQKFVSPTFEAKLTADKTKSDATTTNAFSWIKTQFADKLYEAQLTSDPSDANTKATTTSTSTVSNFSAKLYEAKLTADPSGANTTVTNANKDATSGWVTPTYQAKLTADPGPANTTVTNANTNADTNWGRKTYDASLTATKTAADSAVTTAGSFATSNWADKTYTAALSAQKGAVDTAITQAETAGGGWNSKSYEAALKANAGTVAGSVTSAENIAAPWGTKSYEAQLKAKNAVTTGENSEIDKANTAITNNYKDKDIKLGVVVDAQTAQKIENVNSYLRDLTAWYAEWAADTLEWNKSGQKGPASPPPNKPVPKFDAGGLVKGPAGVDVIDARLSAGEFVLSAAAVNAIGIENVAALNRLRGNDRPSSSAVDLPALVARLIAAIEKLRDQLGRPNINLTNNAPGVYNDERELLRLLAQAQLAAEGM